MIHIVNGSHDHNEYFIFREDNKEVKIDVSGGYIKADHILKPEERKYINEIILMREDKEYEDDEQKPFNYSPQEPILKNNSTTKFFDKALNKFKPNIRIDGKKVHLGTYDFEFESDLIYKKAINNKHLYKGNYNFFIRALNRIN